MVTINDSNWHEHFDSYDAYVNWLESLRDDQFYADEHED